MRWDYRLQQRPEGPVHCHRKDAVQPPAPPPPFPPMQTRFSNKTRSRHRLVLSPSGELSCPLARARARCMIPAADLVYSLIERGLSDASRLF